jgi:hypothetical protein
MDTCEMCSNGHCCNDLGCEKIPSFTLADVITKAIDTKSNIVARNSGTPKDYQLYVESNGCFHWREIYPNNFVYRGNELEPLDIIATDWEILYHD